MADNISLRMTYETITNVGITLDGFVAQISAQLRSLGYSDDVIEFELGLLFARRAAKFGIDLLVARRTPPKPPNGHNNP